MPGRTNVRGDRIQLSPPEGLTDVLRTLKKRYQSDRRDDAGFTLIELLIVIIILGVLAGVVVFSVAGINDRGAKSACKSDVKTVTAAAEAYYANNNAYAASIAALKTAGLLQEVPTSAQYTIGYAVNAGPPASVVVTGTLTGGGNCLA